MVSGGGVATHRSGIVHDAPDWPDYVGCCGWQPECVGLLRSMLLCSPMLLFR
jgi:hypothetical protein